ncbi:hypothetical protein ACSMX9_04800 [Streptomyces sp. LE64]|uniref:hypothetical protein n=1 Tax=Streptomyces sp. LE64 TaxID=3448653 RepID=UPI0040431B47
MSTVRHQIPARSTRALPRTALALGAAVLLTGLAAPTALADTTPEKDRAASAAADRAAGSPEVADTLARFFAQDGAPAAANDAARVSRADAAQVEDGAVPVHHLSPDFVAGERGAPVAVPVYHASRAVAADGRTASLWTARHEGRWQVVNIATGDDETRYAALGERKLPGGTVFQEPQVGAWYVHRGDRVVPLDGQARKAIGADGASLAEYRTHVRRAYGDKLKGSAYAKSGKAGGYGATAATGAGDHDAPVSRAAAPVQDAAGPVNVSVAVASGAAGVGALAALLWAGTALRRRADRPAG